MAACVGFWECVEPGSWSEWTGAGVTAIGIFGALLGYALNRRAKWRDQATKVIVRSRYNAGYEGHEVLVENQSGEVIVDPELWFYKKNAAVRRAMLPLKDSGEKLDHTQGITFEAWEDRSGESMSMFKRIKSDAVTTIDVPTFEGWDRRKLVFFDAKGRRWMTDIESGRVKCLWGQSAPFTSIR